MRRAFAWGWLGVELESDRLPDTLPGELTFRQGTRRLTVSVEFGPAPESRFAIADSVASVVRRNEHTARLVVAQGSAPHVVAAELAGTATQWFAEQWWARLSHLLYQRDGLVLDQASRPGRFAVLTPADRGRWAAVAVMSMYAKEHPDEWTVRDEEALILRLGDMGLLDGQPHSTVRRRLLSQLGELNAHGRRVLERVWSRAAVTDPASALERINGALTDLVSLIGDLKGGLARELPDDGGHELRLRLPGNGGRVVPLILVEPDGRSAVNDVEYDGSPRVLRVRTDVSVDALTTELAGVIAEIIASDRDASADAKAAGAKQRAATLQAQYWRQRSPWMRRTVRAMGRRRGPWIETMLRPENPARPAAAGSTRSKPEPLHDPVRSESVPVGGVIHSTEQAMVDAALRNIDGVSDPASFGRRMIAVDGRPGVVRYHRDGRSFDIRVEMDEAYATPTLLLAPDDVKSAVRGRLPEAVLRVPVGLPTDELAGWLVWAGGRVGALRRGLGRRLWQVYSHSARPDLLNPKGVARKRFLHFGPEDQGRLARLAYRLQRLESASDKAPAHVVAALDAGMARDLADLGVLRDQKGGLARAEAVGRWLLGAGLPPSAVVRVMEHLFGTRADTDPDKLVQAVRAAAAAFAATSRELRGAGVHKDGDRDVLRLRLDPGVRPEPDDDRRLMAFDIEVVSGAQWPRTMAVRLDVAGDRRVLQVRRDAGDAALRVGVAGVLTAWLAAEAASGRPALGLELGQPLDDQLLHGLRLLAEHEALLRLRNAGTSTIARWTRAKAGRPTFHQRMLDRLLGMQAQSMRELLQEPGLPAAVGNELRAALAAQHAGPIAAVRAAARSGTSPAPVPSKPGLSEHTMRRVVSTVLPMATTAGAGLLAGRTTQLIAASLAGQGAAAAPQAWSDAANARMSAGGDELPKDRLAKPDLEVDRSALDKPSWAGPMANITKRSPSGLAQSLASLAAVVAADPSRAVTGGIAVGLTVLANLAQAAADWVFDHPEKVASDRYAHAWSRTNDKLRNDFVESAYYRIRELLARKERDRQVSGRLRVDGAMRADLEQTRRLVADMMADIAGQTDNLIAEMIGRRKSPFHRSELAETYNLVARGVADGKPSRLHNALRVSSQHSAAQLPSLVLGFLAASAVDLLQLNVVAAAVSGGAYGAGWSGLKWHEFADLVAVASWDTLERLRYIDQAADYLLNGDRNAELTPPRAIDEHSQADPGNSWWLRKVRSLGMTALAEARAQGRANDAAGRPREVSGRLQLYYKHLPTMASYLAAAGPLTLVFPVGIAAGVVLGVGAAAKLVTGLGENILRVSAPLYGQVASIRSALSETQRMTSTKAELADEIHRLLDRAKTVNERIRPVPGPGWPGTLDTLRHMPRSLRQRLDHHGRLVRRAVIRIGTVSRRGEPPALWRAAPVERVRLTRRDHRAINELYDLAKDLDHAYDPLRTARADLTPERVGIKVSLLLDRFGLRTGQDPDGRRWAAVTADLRRRHGYLVTGNSPLARLRDTLPADPALKTDDVGVEEPASEGVVLDTHLAAAGRALGEAHRNDPLTMRLWAAVNGPRLAGYRIDVRAAGRIKAFPPDGHRFAVQITTAVPGPGTRAELRLAPDDLRHAFFRTHRGETHQLTVHPDHANDAERLAEILGWALNAVIVHRMESEHRVSALLHKPQPTRFTLPVGSVPPPDRAQAPSGASPTDPDEPERPATPSRTGLPIPPGLYHRLSGDDADALSGVERLRNLVVGPVSERSSGGLPGWFGELRVSDPEVVVGPGQPWRGRVVGGRAGAQVRDVIEWVPRSGAGDGVGPATAVEGGGVMRAGRGGLRAAVVGGRRAVSAWTSDRGSWPGRVGLRRYDSAIERAYLAATDNVGRRSVLIDALPGLTHVAMHALAGFAADNAHTDGDRADVEVLRLLAFALSPSYVAGGEPDWIAGLDAVGRYEWSSAVFALHRKLPRSRDALKPLMQTLVRCAPVSS
ncbi:hypothetical protein [Micromonospora sp. NPDC023814]|uniref:hypothetical protein n=1 Tax=Micromonospora sp. NPDC023814 TaxID=3154596 RepID=UPI0033D35EDA